MGRIKTVLCGAVIVSAVMAVAAQTPAPKSSFEVAAIKPYTPSNGGQPVLMGFHLLPGGRFTAANVTLTMLLTYAYHMDDYQVVGGPGWITSDRWEITAKAEEGTFPAITGRLPPEVSAQLKLIVQTLLAERFQIKSHREMRELPMFDLVVDKGGSKLHLSEDQTPGELPMPGKPLPLPPPARPGAPILPPRGNLSVSSVGTGGQSRLMLQANACGLSSIVIALSNQLGASVVDKTGLKDALYDAKLQWVPDSASSPLNTAMVSIFTALQDQLGLKLVATKGPIEVLVIDSVQKPIAN